MKNFNTILMVLAAGASFVTARPAPAGAETNAVEARGQEFYALHVRESKHQKRALFEFKNLNSTLDASPANNGTADGDDGKGKGKGKKGKKDKDDKDDVDAEDILKALLALLTGKGSKKDEKIVEKAASKGQDPLAILQGFLNKSS